MGLSLSIVILIVLIGYNIIPVLNQFITWFSAYAFLLDLFIINPIIAFIGGLIFGLLSGARLWVPILIGLLFVPTALLFYNSSALVYALLYFGLALLGMILGSVIYNRKQKRSNIETSIRRHGIYD